MGAQKADVFLSCHVCSRSAGIPDQLHQRALHVRLTALDTADQSSVNSDSCKEFALSQPGGSCQVPALFRAEDM